MRVKRVATIVLAAIVTGCPRLSVVGEPMSRTHQHELHIGGIGDVTTLNPLLSSDLVVGWMSQLTMARLVRYDRTNRPIPELASAVPDHTTSVRVTIRASSVRFVRSAATGTTPSDICSAR